MNPTLEEWVARLEKRVTMLEAYDGAVGRPIGLAGQPARPLFSFWEKCDILGCFEL